MLATFTYPIWRPEPIEIAADGGDFPELTEEQQQILVTLPLNIQRGYITMRQINAPMAIDLLTARLQPPEPLPLEDQELPPIQNATVIARGGFARVILPEGDEREPQPLPELFTASGEVILYQFPDNRKMLRLEEVQIINGPNLRVMLSSNPGPVNGDELLADRLRIDLGPLLTTSGSMTYVNVPVEISIADYNSVIIYDSTYNLIFGVARI